MKKMYKYLAVLSMLVIMPALSWYYLDIGLEYRKEAEVEMKSKGSLASMMSNGSFTTEFDLKTMCLDATSIFIYRKDQKNDRTIERLYDQFKDAYTFQIIVLNKEGLAPLDIFSKDNIRVVPAELNTDYDFALLDIKDQLRNEYKVEDVNKLVNHTALILPKRPGRDVKTKN